MSESLLPYLVGIVLLGVTAQWLAWRLGLPSILLLLTFGLVAGPLTGWLKPDDIFGEIIPPTVSLAVAVILYEGGLTLRISELRKIGRAVVYLVFGGAIVTWLVSAVAAHLIFGFSAPLSALTAAVLVVTGPTVIAPLLRHIRPTGVVGPILKWEGIVIDPIGALLAVLIYEAIVIGSAQEATVHVAVAILKTVFIGGELGHATRPPNRVSFLGPQRRCSVTLCIVFDRPALYVVNALWHDSPQRSPPYGADDQKTRTW